MRFDTFHFLPLNINSKKKGRGMRLYRTKLNKRVTHERNFFRDINQVRKRVADFATDLLGRRWWEVGCEFERQIKLSVLYSVQGGLDTKR